MAIDWPATLPDRFQQSGFTESSPNQLLRFQTDIGPGKVRRRSSASIRPVTGVMWLTRAQTDTLKQFVESLTLGGSLAFTFPLDPMVETPTPVLARFAENALPTYAPLNDGADWAVSFTLELLP